MKRRQNIGTAYLPTDPKDVHNFIATRNAQLEQMQDEDPAAQVTTPHTPRNPAMPVSHLNAAALLNPRAGVAKTPARSSTNGAQFGRPGFQQLAPTFSFSTPNDPIDVDDNHAPRQSSMIERMHNLEDRVDRPSKRLKRSTSPSGSETSKSSHRTQARRHGGGAVAQHIRDHRAQLAQKDGTTASLMAPVEVKSEKLLQEPQAAQATPSSRAIDLTADDVNGLGQDTEKIDLTADAAHGEQDFYVVNGRKVYFDVNNYDEKEVCYGRLEGTRIIAHTCPDPKKPISNRPEWPSIKVELQREFGSTSGRIKAIDPAGQWIGTLDPKTAFKAVNEPTPMAPRATVSTKLTTRALTGMRSLETSFEVAAEKGKPFVREKDQ